MQKKLLRSVRNDKKRVLIALSGGIDSAVSAYLLIQKGYYVETVFMKNWTSQEGLLKNECPWLSDRRDALRVAAFLGIKMHTLDFEKQYQKNVIKYFFTEYKKGRTPNPDVMCNKEIKFKLLYNWAMRRKFDYLATGHYAKIGLRAKRKGLRKKDLALSAIRYQLGRSVDEFKDQTYFIYNIKAEQLPHLLFPIGGMKKSAVRSLARKIGLPNAEKKESMGLCFVGKIRLKDFLEQKIRGKRGEILLSSLAKSRHPESVSGSRLRIKPGMTMTKKDPIVTETVIGRHQGLHNYTIGQRQGIKIGSGGPYFVFGKDLSANRLFVTNDENDPRLFTKEAQIHSVNWLNQAYSVQRKEGNGSSKLHATCYTLTGRYRHQGKLVSLTITKIKTNLYQVEFEELQKAVASGQSLVLYKGKECVGGGIIA